MDRHDAASTGISARRVSWKARHAIVVTLAIAATFAFAELRKDWSPMHRWNRALGDVSMLFITVAMVIGPVSRLRRGTGGLVAWRREFGIWGTALAIAHVVIVFDGWVEWDLMRLFGYEWHPTLKRYVMLQHGFGLANIVGILALFYACILAATSNDRCQRFLGGGVWKFVQQRAYVLWALAIVHTAYFLYLHFQDFHRRVPEPNLIQFAFLIVIATVLLLQGWAFFNTWKIRRRARTPGAAPPGEKSV